MESTDGTGVSPRMARWARVATAWSIAIALSYAIATVGAYRLKDPDSTLYESISQNLAATPLSQWINPQWPPDRAKSGPFQEHLAIFFWPSAALTSVGFERGALLFNLLSVAALCLALELLARKAFTEHYRFGIASALFIISPWGIQYSLRANHELIWTAFTVAALAMIFHPNRWRALLGFALFAAGGFLIKGVLALLLLPCALVIGWRAQSLRRALAMTAAALLLILACACAYELAYRAMTGVSFFGAYVSAQLGYVRSHESASAWMKPFNLAYYALGAAWFCVPSAIAVALLRKSWDARASSLTLGVFAWILPLALMSRHAIRYALPPMLVLHAIAAGFLTQKRWHSPPARRLFELRLLDLLAPAALVLIVAARTAIDPLVYRNINPFG